MKPPRLARLLAALLMPPSYRDEHLGDLSEGFHRLLPDVRAARRWYRRQALASILPALRMRGRALRDSDPTLLMRSLRQDLLYGLRSLARSRMFSVVAVLTLALAIGVNTSIFSLVNVIVFADLPMQEVETATVLRTRNPALEVEQGGISLPDFLDVSERARSFEALTALADDQWVLTGADVPTRVGGYRITANLMEAWGLQPLAGRGFAAGDDRPGAAPVAMLSQGFWQSQF
ncbi:MAG: ABC transporter permease, partial [Gemmatimonadetes bacterium]|nr:ABC transporter permease [Gemmatimonadota bacterium]